MRTRASSIALSAALVILTTVSAWAHDHKPPRSFLSVQRAEQRGILGTYCWIAPGTEPDSYTQQCIDAIPTWPRAVRATPGKETRVRFNSPTQPDDLSIAYWRHIDENGGPKGEATTLDATLEPIEDANGAVVAWQLVFKLPDRGRHMYLHAAGYWQDQDGSGNPQDASWTYHVRLRQP
ncbi:MAG: hypothetical protein QOG54_1985 [Actinomycetota bacterium]|nr:hypothetical protein [Actinomycetota bacterium]